MSRRDRLRIAVQRAGRLADAGEELLIRCGLEFRPSRDRLFCFGETQPVDLLRVRDDDIPGMIADGTCDIGIVGRNVLREATLAAGECVPHRELRALGFGGCRLAIAIPENQSWSEPAQLAGRRIATSYPRLLAAWLEQHSVAAEIVNLSGSVEIAPRLGSADAICDLVASGATLAANQLKETAVLLQSEAVLCGAAKAPGDGRGALLEQLLRRLDGVLDVRESRLVMLNAPRTALATITGLLPGRPCPTVTHIDGDPERIALQALCRGTVGWTELEAMRNAGAQSMLVLPVEKMLA